MRTLYLSAQEGEIIEAARRRNDRCLGPIIHGSLTEAVRSACERLLERHMFEEHPATRPDWIWRLDPEKGPLMLRLTSIGKLVPTEIGEEPHTNDSAQPTGKLDRLINLLSTPSGATIDQMSHVTGWQPHTIRGAMAGPLKRKRGLNVVSEKNDGGKRIYRVLDAT